MSGNTAHYLTLHSPSSGAREVVTECLVAPDEICNRDAPALRVTVNRTRQPARTLATLDMTVHEALTLIRQLSEAVRAAV